MAPNAPGEFGMAGAARAGGFGSGGVGGLYLHRFLPQAHLTPETLDIIKLGTGMLSVLAFLVLRLLIATARARMIRPTWPFETTPRSRRCRAKRCGIMVAPLLFHGTCCASISRRSSRKRGRVMASAPSSSRTRRQRCCRSRCARRPAPDGPC
jgi:hypothetical protein